MRLSLLSMSIGAFAIGTTEFIVMGILPVIADSEGVSLATAGLLVSAYALGVVIGAPLLTVTTTRIPRKALLIVLMVAFATANLVTALAPDFTTLLLSRLVAGLPHGAFFGAAAVVGANLVPYERRARAIAVIMSGLTVSTIAGVPLGAVVVNHVDWRWVFVGVAVLALVCALAVAMTVPNMNGRVPTTKPWDEIKALGNRRVILTLVNGAVGFGAMFACYTYLSPILSEVTGFDSLGIAATLAVFGIGMTVGNLVGGTIADQRPLTGLYWAFGLAALILTFMYATVAHPVMAVSAVFALALCVSTISPILQRLLLDGAHDAPSLASALHHSAFNLANANGAWVGGLVLSAGFGPTSPLLAGVGLALAGLAIAAVLDRAHRLPSNTVPTGQRSPRESVEDDRTDGDLTSA